MNKMLTGQQRKDLCQALCAAFQTRSELVRMVSFGLNQNLNTLTTANGLDTTIFDLVEWVESKGLVAELIWSAVAINSTNQALLDIADRLQLLIGPIRELYPRIQNLQRIVMPLHWSYEELCRFYQ